MGAWENCPFARFNFSKVYFRYPLWQQNLGIDDFLFTYIVVLMPQHGNEIPMLLCQNFIPTSLSGNEIPTKWRGNEIPTNRPSELYTIYNPASWSPSLSPMVLLQLPS